MHALFPGRSLSYRPGSAMCQPVSPPPGGTLQPLFEPIETLPGVGPATAEKLARVAGGGRVLDLLFHMPDGYVDRRHRVAVRDLAAGRISTIEVDVVSTAEPMAGTKQPWKAVVTDGTGFAELAFWRALPREVRKKRAAFSIRAGGAVRRRGVVAGAGGAFGRAGTRGADRSGLAADGGAGAAARPLGSQAGVGAGAGAAGVARSCPVATGEMAGVPGGVRGRAPAAGAARRGSAGAAGV